MGLSLNKVSIIIPTTRPHFIRYLLSSLRRQTYPFYEAIFVTKFLDPKLIERLCHQYSIVKPIVIPQERGYFIHALNLGKKIASGDLLLFTDDDVILPKSWVKKYVELHKTFKNAGAISSRDITIYTENGGIDFKLSREDMLHRNLYHWLLRSLINPPHQLFKKYRLGIYLTKDYKINYGLHFPRQTCFSLPFRGANMSFKKEAVEKHAFPEHPLIRRGLGNEQYIGIALVIDGWESIYTPNNPVLHFWQEESLSKFKKKSMGIEIEKKIMRDLILDLIRRAKN